MSIDDKHDANWYYQDPVSRWKGFSADKLKGNEIRNGEFILAKIPQMPGLITRKSRTDEHGRKTTYIELVTERWYDRDKKQTRNKRVCIGIDISYLYRGMMIINEKYHDYFNSNGDLIFTPKIEKKEKEPKREESDISTDGRDDNGSAAVGSDLSTSICSVRDDNEAAATGLDLSTTPDGSSRDDTLNTGVTVIAAEEKKEKHMEKSDQEIQAELDMKEHMKDRIEFLGSLLHRYDGLVEDQLAKRPNQPMTRYQIERINELLREIKMVMSPFEYGEYLQLADGEEGEDGRMTTYADMAVLLKNYVCVMDSYKYGRIWYK